LTLAHAIYLFCAATLAGALNAIAGGGSFISFPTLIFTGVPPIPANATNNVSAWTGLVASSGAYRDHLDVPRRMLLPLAVVGIVGGTAGSLLLLKTPARTFDRVLPWLMLGATLLFVFGRKLVGQRISSVGHQASGRALGVAAFVLFCAAVYGGYFGGGLGIILLALLAGLGMSDIHAMNALKTLLSSLINGLALVMFIIARVIYWPQAGVMIGGALLGGYFGAHYGKRLPPKVVRVFVIVVGSVMTVYFFRRAYL
jgi:uncharacterized protein